MASALFCACCRVGHFCACCRVRRVQLANCVWAVSRRSRELPPIAQQRVLLCDGARCWLVSPSSHRGRRRRAGFEPERRRRQVNRPMAYRCAGLFAVSVTRGVSALWRFAEERPARGAGASAFGVTRLRCAMVTTRAASRAMVPQRAAACGKRSATAQALCCLQPLLLLFD